MTDKRQQQRRDRLFRQHPFCFFCCIRLVLIKGAKIKFYPDNAATMEHRRTRFDPARGTDHRRQNWTVLACKKCNEARGRAAELAAGIDELRQRAQRHPSRLGDAES